MGCDIHTVVQRRAGTTWEVVEPPAEMMLDQYGPLWEDRNYTLFGILAGVRDPDVPPVAAPKGLPSGVFTNDSDDDLPEPYYDLGEHNFSWLTVAELDAYDWSAPHPSWPAEGPIGEVLEVERWLSWMRSLGKPDEVRLVFGFDS